MRNINARNKGQAETPVGATDVPRHVAIIMDGNGRWASIRGLPRIEGHRRGVDSVRALVEHAGSRGIECLTLFAFSKENWSRPQSEVLDLMGLLKRYIRQDLSELHRNGVQIRIIGSRDIPDVEILGLIEECENLTGDNSGMKLVVAFNYGGQDEIVRAARKIAGKVAAGQLAALDVTDEVFSAHLDTAGLPDLDLLIRTGGELRLSNFLLWQSAYAEFVFADDYWPDFTAETFDAALDEYAGRERRFGGVTTTVTDQEKAAR